MEDLTISVMNFVSTVMLLVAEKIEESGKCKVRLARFSSISEPYFDSPLLLFKNLKEKKGTKMESHLNNTPKKRPTQKHSSDREK